MNKKINNFINIDQLNFQKVVSQKNKLVLIEASAPWCGACKSLDSILEEISVTYTYSDKIVVGILDVDKNLKLIDNLKIMSVPTIIVFQAGLEKKRIFGEVSKAELLKELVPLLNIQSK
jgi:thioredoxin 1